MKDTIEETEWDFNKRVVDESEAKGKRENARVHGKLNWVCRAVCPIVNCDWVTDWLWLVQICTGAECGTLRHQHCRRSVLLRY